MSDESKYCSSCEAFHPVSQPCFSQTGRIPSGSNSEIPRRCRMDLWTPAERSIFDAVQAVEAVGAHPLLTDAVVMLTAARRKVADFIDLPPTEQNHNERRESDMPRYPKIKLSDDPKKALLEIASYLETVEMNRNRKVVENGEVVGYWQTPEWCSGLGEIAGECHRLVGL